MGKTVFMFPGQGTQTVGMLQDIYHEFPIVQETFCEAEEILGRDIRNIMLQGPAEELGLTVNTQPIVFTAEVALFRMAIEQELQADYLIGYSLGEWAAVVAGDVLSFEEALRLVCIRAEAMQSAVPVGEGGMAVIMGKTKEEVWAICEDLSFYAAPSNFNYPEQITVSGDIRAIHELMVKGEAGEIVVNPLAISVPSHCSLMQPGTEKLAAALETVAFRDSRYPIVMNATGDVSVDAEVIKRNLVVQLTTAVQFESSVQTLWDHGVDTFLELGPGKTLAGFVRKNAKAFGKEAFSSRMDSLEAIRTAATAVKGRC